MPKAKQLMRVNGETETSLADVRPFLCRRPVADLASEVAALPYDVFTRKEAAAEIDQHPNSFLRIDRSCALLPAEVDEFDAQAYEKAAELYTADVQAGVFLDEDKEYYYLYRLTQDGRAQTGIVSRIAVEDFHNGVIKRHENTRDFKLEDRVCHIEALNAQTGLVFVAYRVQAALGALIEQLCATTVPLYDFSTSDGVGHTVWRVDDKNAEELIRTSFERIDALYIADGHHRAAAAAKVAAKTEAEEASFLIAAFATDQLRIFEYNRVLFDTNGLSPEELLERIAGSFDIEKIGINPQKPSRRGEFALYLDEQWYLLSVHEELRPDDPVDGLDVTLLYDLILQPILGVGDPSQSKRIAHVGGVRGLEELKSRASEYENGISFALYPCSLEEFFAVADAGLLMPPKSTWFEPKLRSGLFIHRI